MPRLDCATPAALKKLSKITICANRVLITSLAVGNITDIDLANIADTNEEITALPMSGGATFQELESDIENASLTYTLDDATGFYTTTLTIDVGGFSQDSRDSILSAQGFCDLAFLIATSDCKFRVVGIDKVGTAWKQLLPSKVTGHEGNAGGTNDASNVVTFTSKSLTPPPFTTIDTDNWPLP